MPAPKFALKSLAVALTAALALTAPMMAGPASASMVEAPQATLLYAEGNHIQLTVGKAEVLELPKKAAEVLVSNPAVAEVSLPSQDRIYLLGRGIGTANVFVFDDHGHVITRAEIAVGIDQKQLQATFANLLPNETVRAEVVNGDVVLSGSISSPSAADTARRIARRFVEADENLVDLTTVRGENQVLLQVRIMEAQKSALNELGIDLSYGPDDIGRAVFSAATDSTVGLSNVPFGAGAYSISPSGWGPIAMTLRALEQDGYARMLAEPNLTAVSGEQASFLAGGEFPIPVAQDDDGTLTVEFRQFGVSLAFTPTVMTEDRISLRLGTEVSSLSTEGQITLNNLVIPALAVRRADTTVEMPSGGSLMIAGLLQSDVINNASGLPGVKDMPVLGQLFRSNSFRANESELLIIITPLLVRPHDRSANLLNATRPVEAERVGPVDLGLADGLKATYGRGVDVSAEPVGYLID
ncbi:MAG: type II and III secretion system protein family protein [Alphaproteobacteria bacterium]